jgi:hypothetical protein
MRLAPNFIFIMILVLSLAAAIMAEKQNLYHEQEIQWQTISAGGNTSSDSNISLSGTVGQAVFGSGNSDVHILHSGFRQTFNPYYVCGDANSDTTVNVSDAVWIINYVFVGGGPPEPLKAGDPNCDETVNVSDAVWIINYVFMGSNAPCDTNADGIPDC